MKNLTMAEIKYYTIKNDTKLSVSNKLKELIKIHNELKIGSKENSFHNRKNVYISEMDNGVIVSFGDTVKIYDSNNTLKDSFYKLSKKALLDKIDREIKKTVFLDIRKKSIELYNTKILSHWSSMEQMKEVIKLFKMLNIKITNNFHISKNLMYGQYVLLKDDVISYMNNGEVSYNYNLINLEDDEKIIMDSNLDALIELYDKVSKHTYIKPCYISYEKEKILIQDIVSDNFRDVERYFKNIILPLLIDKECTLIQER